MITYSNEMIRDILAQAAVDALSIEATLTPKPGLVDADNTGAHTDMDIKMFLESAIALQESFASYVCVGMQHVDTPKKLLAKIRPIGRNAEDDMFFVTGGVNTHKGANFSFGVVLSALGLLSEQARANASTYSPHTLTLEQLVTLRQYIQLMTKGLLTDDFKHLTAATAQTFGEKLFCTYNIGGIREEAENGYPAIFELVLPEMLILHQQKCTETQIYHQALLRLMTQVDDSNIIKRGGIEALIETKQRATEFLQNGGVLQVDYLDQLIVLDKEYISRHLSPGGSADLLALAIFLFQLIKV